MDADAFSCQPTPPVPVPSSTSFLITSTIPTHTTLPATTPIMDTALITNASSTGHLSIAIIAGVSGLALFLVVLVLVFLCIAIVRCKSKNKGPHTITHENSTFNKGTLNLKMQEIDDITTSTNECYATSHLPPPGMWTRTNIVTFTKFKYIIHYHCY